MKTLLRTLRWWTQRDRRDADLKEELAFHLNEDAEERKALGLSDHQAQSAARRDLGNVPLIAEEVRAMWTWPGMERIVEDLRFSLRGLARSLGFATVAVLTLGVAIGAATVMYGVVDGVVLQPLPYPRSEHIVQLRQINQSGSQGPFSDPNFEDVQSGVSSFAGVAEYSPGSTSVVAGTLPVRVIVSTVSHDFFDVFVTYPSRGRRFAAEELHEDGPAVAIVSDRFWRQHFDGADDLSAATLRVNERPVTIVGVMPAGFAFPLNVDIWTPREARPRNPYRTGHNWQVVARVKDGVTIDAARAEASTLAQRLKQQHGNGTAMTNVAITPLRDAMVGHVRPVLFLLFASVVLLLGVACANLATLLMARVSTRRRELAIRTALGARGAALLLPIIAESLIIAILGGFLGFLIAAGGIRAVRVLDIADLPRSTEIDLGWTVLLFALVATGLTIVMFAVFSGWQARRLDINNGLKDSDRGHTRGTAARRLRHALVVAQLALSLVLLVGAGLLGRSLAELLRQETGFRRDGLLTITLSHLTPQIRIVEGALELADPTSLPRQARLNELLLQRLRVLPGVVEAGGVNLLPMVGRDGSSGTFLIVRGDDQQAQQVKTLRDLGPFFADPTRTGTAAFRVTSAGYFRAMGIPLVRGRMFEESDDADAPHVALISESLARTRWPNEDPIGLRLQFGGMDGDLRTLTIVGIVGDILEGGLHTAPRPTLYAEYRQRPLTTFDFTFVLQTTLPPTSLVTDARRLIQELSPEAAPRFRAIEEVVDASVAGRRLTLGLTVAFAAAAMLVATLGVYGVLSYLVTQRTQEFGVRIALGARWLDIERLVLLEAGRLIVLGLVIGTSLALAGKRVLEGMLFGIQSTDPATYLGMGGLLAVVAFLACQLPAIRAARVDPLRILKAE
jgi:putative ABC transport system permease protein